MRILIAAAAALSLVLGGGAAVAQTISQPIGDVYYIDGYQGQSFTATVTGRVTQIGVRPAYGITNDNLRIYNGPNGSGVEGSPGEAAYSQTVTTITASSSTAPLQTIVLSTPFPVVAGETYSFVFTYTRLFAGRSDLYADGTFIFNSANSFFDSDLAFEVTQVAAAPASIPTMTEWALILLGATLAGGAALYIQRRRQAV